MTPAPVEIARKVLEAGEKSHGGQGWYLAFTPSQFTSPTLHHPAAAAFMAAACNDAEALARAVQDMEEAGAKMRAMLILSHYACTQAPSGCEHDPCVIRRAINEWDAALSPTEGDGRKDSHGK